MKMIKSVLWSLLFVAILSLVYFFIPVYVEKVPVPVGLSSGKITVLYTLGNFVEEYVAGYVVGNPYYQAIGEPSVEAVEREYKKVNILGFCFAFLIFFLVGPKLVKKFPIPKYFV